MMQQKRVIYGQQREDQATRPERRDDPVDLVGVFLLKTTIRHLRYERRLGVYSDIS